MATRFEWSGLDELKAALRRLPAELAQEGGDIVVRRATEAKEEIVDRYAGHRESGNLESHVKVDVDQRPTGASAVVKSTAKHAFIFEHGTQVRRDSKGRNRGAMPAANIFVPVMIRKRRAMNEDHANLLRQKGLEVTGG